MSTPVVTNIGPTASQALPSAGASTANSTQANNLQSANQVSQSVASQNSKVLANEKAIATDPKRAEGSFDNQRNDPDKKGSSLTAQKEEQDGSLHVVA